MKTKTEAQHTPTPTPWEFERYENDSIIVAPFKPKYGTDTRMLLAKNLSEENAAFIVRAVNSHEALLEACKRIVYNDDTGKERMIGSETAFDRSALKNAITQAEGK